MSKESTQECINEEQPSSGLPLWLIIVIAAIILVAIIVILILVLGKKKNNIDSHYTEFTEVSGTSQNPAQTQ